MTSPIEIRNGICHFLKERPMTRYELEMMTGYSCLAIKNNIEWLEQFKVVKRKRIKVGKRVKELWFRTPKYWERG